jgi:hypothetical protein
VFNIPLAEVVTDYFDQLKSRSKGYASMEYKVGQQNSRWGLGAGSSEGVPVKVAVLLISSDFYTGMRARSDGPQHT